MNKSAMLSALLPKVRREILAATLMHPQRRWYLTNLARHLGLTPSSLQRELIRLTRAGILTREVDGRRVYYKPDAACPILPELQKILIKTAGLTDLLKSALHPLERRIDWAFVYGSIALGKELSTSDVDLMVIGDVGLAELAPVLRKAERQLEREVNPNLYSCQEFAGKTRLGHHFLLSVMEKPKIFIIGDKDELAKLTDGPSR